MLDVKKVTEARNSNPCATLQEIADRHGVSKERIRQVLKKARLPTGRIYQTYECLNCGKDMGPRPYRKFCAFECYHAYSYIKIACAVCGVLKEYNAKQVVWRRAHGKKRTGVFFCSKRCCGFYLGTNFGFGAHPENRSR